jgi:hypothetical protein
VRFLIGIMAMTFLAACDGGSGDAAQGVEAPPGMASEITVELPPPAEPAKVAATGPAGQAGSYRLRPPEPASVSSAWASVLRKNDLPCDRITSARQLEGQDGRPMGIYKIECATGGTYQGTRRDGRLRFRRWTGQLYRA